MSDSCKNLSGIGTSNESSARGFMSLSAFSSDLDHALHEFGQRLRSALIRHELIWAALTVFVYSTRKLLLSTMTFSFIPFPAFIANIYATNTVFEHYILIATIIQLTLLFPLFVIYSVLESFGFLDDLTKFCQRTIDDHGYGFSAVNTAVVVHSSEVDAQTHTSFLGYTRIGDLVNTLQGRTMKVIDRIVDKDDLSTEYVLQDPALANVTQSSKASELLGGNVITVSEEAVCSIGPHIQEIESELDTIGKVSRHRDLRFNFQIASLLTRLNGISFEGDKAIRRPASRQAFSYLSRYGFCDRLSSRLIFNDIRWPSTTVMAFYSQQDSCIILVFRGESPWDMTRTLQNMKGSVSNMARNVAVQRDLWQGLCESKTGTVPYKLINKSLEELRGQIFSNDKPPTVWITGTGHGGALAELFMYIKTSTSAYVPGMSICGYTFGAHRVGNKAYVREFTSRLDGLNSKLFSVQNSLDTGPLMPVGLFSAGVAVRLFYSSNPSTGMLGRGGDLLGWVVSRAKSGIRFATSTSDENYQMDSLYWMIAHPLHPALHDKLPIAYFHSLRDTVQFKLNGKWQKASSF